MPLPLRKVEPVYVSRGNLPEKFKFQNDLEAEANGTLANVILQLSSLSHHAEEIFSDLVRSATDLSTRSINLQGRLNRLTVKVSQLDGVHEELDSMQDCLNSKPFQSSTAVDQQVVSRPTMSASMLQKLMSCDRPPPLEKLNVYRDDGKDGLKFYTDPNYFFDLWRQEMLKDTEKAVRKQLSEELQEPHKPKSEGGQHRKKRVRQPQNTRENQKYKAIQHGEHIMSPILSPTEGSQMMKPLEIGDGILYYPPEMQKKHSSRPTSMEIKHVSFEDMDDKGDRTNSNTKQRLERLSSMQDHQFISNHNYIHDYDEYTNGRMSIEAESPTSSSASAASGSTSISAEFRHRNSQGNSCPSSKFQNLSNNTHNLNFINSNSSNASNSDKINETPNPGQDNLRQTLIRKVTGGSIVKLNKVHKRRSSESSDNSLKINGTIYTRPTQPPPAPPALTSNSSNTKHISGTPSSIQAGIQSSGNSSQVGTPNGNGRVSRPSNARETLPPPPPPPVDDITAIPNGNTLSDGFQMGERNHNNNDSGSYPTPPNNVLSHSQMQGGIGIGSGITMPPPPAQQHSGSGNVEENEEELPPPPPIPDQYQEQENIPKSQSQLPPAPTEEILPPAPPPPLPDDTSDSPVPPPPPPPFMADFKSPVKSPTESANGIGGELVKKKKTVLPPIVDTRSELLEAIRGGIRLKKVDDTKASSTKDDKTGTTYCDVASILARRVAVEMSDSDSGSSEYDSDGWDETSA